MTELTLQEVVDLLRKAEGPCGELDAAIGMAIGLPTIDRTGVAGWHGRYFVDGLPAYTRSFTAAMSLIPEGYDWIIGSTNGGLTCHAEIGGRGEDYMEFGQTPELAICIGALMAIIRMDDPCPRCNDSGYVESVSGGIWTGENLTTSLSVCDCPCGDDVLRERSKSN